LLATPARIKCKLHANIAKRKYWLKSGQMKATISQNQTTKRHIFE